LAKKYIIVDIIRRITEKMRRGTYHGSLNVSNKREEHRNPKIFPKSPADDQKPIRQPSS
jgi:hypothetical protein